MTRQPVLNVMSLRRMKTFSRASDQQLKNLVSQITLERFERRSTLFTEGSASDTLYVLVSGVIKISLSTSKGEDILVSLVSPGELFGITSLLPGMQRPFRAEAFSDCWVGRLSPEALVTTLLGIPFADFSVFMSGTVSRWFGLLHRYAHFQGLDLHQRLSLALLELAHKFGVQDDRGTLLILQLTHEDLADLVGASRQKVTEHMRELERQQLLQRDGRKLIVATERLQKTINIDQL